MRKLYHDFIPITTPTALVVAGKNPVEIAELLILNATASTATVTMYIAETAAGVTSSNAVYFNYEVDSYVTDKLNGFTVPRGYSLFGIAGTESALVAVISRD